MIGGVRHQFHYNPGGGFTAKLAVAFPALLPPWCAPEHRWHLAFEFSNWITAYATTTAYRPPRGGRRAPTCESRHRLEFG